MGPAAASRFPILIFQIRSLKAILTIVLTSTCILTCIRQQPLSRGIGSNSTAVAVYKLPPPPLPSLPPSTNNNSSFLPYSNSSSLTSPARAGHYPLHNTILTANSS
ncbi:hypothetical protein BU16DRAFT_204383 [Lophium mytilinum]|uniref:Uncharacterized protein n=1 Tax=Lophium mytilinum TaxID=390894 RepID=A0A6A6RB97_9PEZI|nr:hypothetical protein BU16DRAFT_204383 [Lophium mytilinum]